MDGARAKKMRVFEIKQDGDGRLTGMMGACIKCGAPGYVMPLHDERGGPPFCFMCAGAWHAEHRTRRSRARCRESAARLRGGWRSYYGKDFDELKLCRRPGSCSPYEAVTGDERTFAISRPNCWQPPSH